MMKAALNPYLVCQAANELIQKEGFDQVDMAAIARKAAIDEAALYTLFGSKQDIILFLYQSINADWQLSVRELTAKKLSDRFEQAMMAKIRIMEPYSELLAHMMGQLLQHSKIGIQAPRTAHIRAVGLQTMQALIDGATDSRSIKKKVVQLPSLLYILHWAVLFLNVHTRDRHKTEAAVKMVAKLLHQAGNIAPVLSLFPFFNELSSWAGSLLTETEQINFSVEREILKIIFNSRKTAEADATCIANTCATCMSLHEERIHYFTQQQLPVHFILPAFPAKSPNLAKVLGKLPDLGEEIALKTLDDLCREIRGVYAPGARITICSDGRIFSELVGVPDHDVTGYVREIKAMIGRLELQHISIVNLEDLMEGPSFDALRHKVIDAYAEPLEDMQTKLKSNAEFKSLFNGIHRFITEDRKALHPEMSGSKIKQESSGIALEVIRYSNAWTRFLSYVYPDAIRLSIHPYPSHSDKIGIQLTKANDNWLTPWHGVIVLQQDGYLLLKKKEAVELGARLVLQDGRPYYYTSIPVQ